MAADQSGWRLDGGFIGACTTIVEDFILKAVVLSAGFHFGTQPRQSGKKRIIPRRLKTVKFREEEDIYE